ncbi:hypothetical protein [Kribbella lupini]|uniref:Peptidase inhibitor family I36 n=1 Tax=Kribbella lupini TaxID=291602 RepID=A0ABN2AMF9_9ACTN
MALGRIRKWAAATAVTMIAATVLVPEAARAQAAPDVTAGPTAWAPRVDPMFPNEYVIRDVSSASRNDELRKCRSEYACFSVGQGDGRHTIFRLYRCETRNLFSFINALAVYNNQTGGVSIEFWGNNYYRHVPPDRTIHLIEDYATYDFFKTDLC